MASAAGNKQTVERFFEAVRAGETDTFDELIVEDYVQHNPEVGNGRQAVKTFFEAAGPVDVEMHRLVAEDDLVAAHSFFNTWNTVGVDIFRFDDQGRIIEHWDVLQPVSETAS